MSSRESPIVAHIERHAHASPGAPAVVDRSGGVTFGQLWDDVSACADLLVSCGAKAGQAVGILLPNCALFVTALLGSARVGNPAILLPVTLPAGELREHCREAGARLVLAGSGQRPLLGAAGGRLLRRGRPDLQVYAVDAGSRSGVRQGDFIGQLTSGVDHPSKIAIRMQTAVWAEIQDFADEISLSARDVTLVLPSIAHSYGLIGGTLAPLCRGACAVLGDRLAPEDVFRTVHEARPTILFAVPMVYRALVAASGTEDDLSSLRLCLSAGAPLPRDVDEGFAVRYGKRIGQDYGSTEAGVISLRLEWTPQHAASVGRPVRHRSVTIVDACGHPLGPGQVGEIVVRSAALARGYLSSRPASFPGSMLEGDRFTTGDLGWLDEEGYLFLAGRKSSLIHAAGGTIDPAEVESVIAQLPAVREVAVVGVPSASSGERVKAVVAAEGLTAATVLQHCRRHLAGNHVPEIVEFCDALPRTAAGKILRRALRTPTGELC